MKIKNKIILGITSLLVLSGVSAATSTFAWYTANRQVELGVTNVGATAQLSTLNMTYDTEKNTRNAVEGGVDPMTGGIPADTTAFAGTFIKDLTDVSSKGNHTFVKPIWGPSVDTINNTGTAVGFWKDEDTYQATQNAENSVFYHQLVFTFTVSGDKIVDLYLSPKSKVTNSGSSIINAADAVRFSMSSKTGVDGSTDTQMIYANPNGDGESTYLAGTTDTTATTIGDNPGFGVLEKSSFFAKNKNFTPTELYFGDGEAEGLVKDDDVTTGFLAQLGPSVTTVDVTVDMWIEGTDTNCKDTDDADFEGIFDTNLEFYTLDQSIMTNTGSN